MSDNENVRFTFNDTEQVGSEPDTSRLPAFRRFDPDPGIDAEIAVERGVATPEQEEYVEQLKAERPLGVETGDKIEVEVTEEQAASGKAIYFVDEAGAPLLANEDGSVTRRDSAVPDPREEVQ